MFNLIKIKNIDNFFKKLFYVDFITYAMFMVFCSSSLMYLPIPSKIISIVVKITFLLTFTIVCYNIISGKFKKFELFLFFIICFIFGLQYYHTRNSLALVVLFYIYAMKGVDLDDLFKKLFVAFVIAYVFVILCRVIGISKEITSIQNRNGIMKNRYGLGFIYSPFASIILLYISFLYIYIKNMNIKYFQILIIFILNNLIYIFTDTKNCYAFIIFTIIVLLILLQKPNNIFIKKIKSLLNKIVSFFAIFIYPISAIFIIYTTLLYEKNIPIIYKFNFLLSGRIALGFNALKQYGFPLIGTKVSYSFGEGYNYVDSAYIQVLLSNGIIVLIISLLIYMIVGYGLVKKKNYIGSLIMIVIGMRAAFEPIFLSIVYVPYLMSFLENLENIILENKILKNK